jgi:hydrogenase maturation factor
MSDRPFTAQLVQTSFIAKLPGEFFLVVVGAALAILVDEAAVESLQATEFVQLLRFG